MVLGIAVQITPGIPPAVLLAEGHRLIDLLILIESHSDTLGALACISAVLPDLHYGKRHRAIPQFPYAVFCVDFRLREPGSCVLLIGQGQQYRLALVAVFSLDLGIAYQQIQASG
jgi:hypothetical protein